MSIVIEDFVKYHVDDNGILKSMENIGEEARSVSIPHILHTGDVIEVLGKRFLKYQKFTEVIVSDEITKVEEEAFALTYVKKVKWSSGCKKISAYCFRASETQEISNIDHVTSICRGAFTVSSIRDFKWPTKCKKIPRSCFDSSMLRSITNMENVKTVGDTAFSACRLTTFAWPSCCPSIPADCFRSSVLLKSVTNLENIQSIGESAFSGTSIEEMDLSCSSMVCIAPNAFNGVNKDNIILPYYLDKSMLVSNEQIDAYAALQLSKIWK